mgnify:FL=1
MLPCHAATVPGCNPEPSRFPSGWALLVVLNARKRPRERAQVLQWLGVFGRYTFPVLVAPCKRHPLEVMIQR